MFERFFFFCKYLNSCIVKYVRVQKTFTFSDLSILIRHKQMNSSALIYFMLANILTKSIRNHCKDTSTFVITLSSETLNAVKTSFELFVLRTFVSSFTSEFFRLTITNLLTKVIYCRLNQKITLVRTRKSHSNQGLIEDCAFSFTGFFIFEIRDPPFLSSRFPKFKTLL